MYRKKAQTPRVRAAAVMLLATVAVGAAGCGTATDRDASAGQGAGVRASSTPATPKEALLAAVPDGSQGSFRFALVDPEATGSGVVDPATKTVHLTTVVKDVENNLKVTMSFLVIDQESWMKVSFNKRLPGLPKLPKKWLHLDRKQIKDDDAVLTFDDPDPAATSTLFEASADVVEVGTGRYRGTVDLTAATNAEVVDAETLAALGEAAKRVPFEAVVDSAGRLTSVAVDVPAAGETPAFRHTAKYHDYGTATAPAAPAAGQAQEAPAEAYEMLNG